MRSLDTYRGPDFQERFDRGKAEFTFMVVREERQMIAHNWILSYHIQRRYYVSNGCKNKRMLRPLSCIW